MKSINQSKFSEESIPYFCWDRNWTVAEIKKRLHEEERINILSWILREAKLADVWYFTSPQQILSCFDDLKLRLGRKRKFWEYILNEWQKLGKI
jgi:hypothetical protein